MTETLFCEFAAVLNYSSNAPSYQACSAGPTADRRGCGAERADGGRAGTPLQAGPPTWALCLGRCGAGEADTRDLVDWSKEPIPGHALKVSAMSKNSSEQPLLGRTLLKADLTLWCFTWFQPPPRHSFQGVHPALLHTTLPWQSLSLPKTEPLLPLYHPPSQKKGTNLGKRINHSSCFTLSESKFI